MSWRLLKCAAFPAGPHKRRPRLPAQPPPAVKAGLEGFDGLAEALGGTVLGQPDYLQKAGHRAQAAVVMGHEGESAQRFPRHRSGGHRQAPESVCAAAEELARRGVFVSGDISWMDLSLYPTAAEEKFFCRICICRWPPRATS